MPLILTGQNTLEIKDNVSGTTLEFGYRLPTQAERTAYTKATIQHKGNKVLSKANTFQEQAALGRTVLLGFRKGDLANEAGKLISSDKSDPDYDPTWKDMLAKYRPDILAAVGRLVIKSTSTPEEDNNFEVVEDFGDDPLNESSSDTSKDAPDMSDPLPTA